MNELLPFLALVETPTVSVEVQPPDAAVTGPNVKVKPVLGGTDRVGVELNPFTGVMVTVKPALPGRVTVC